MRLGCHIDQAKADLGKHEIRFAFISNCIWATEN